MLALLALAASVALAAPAAAGEERITVLAASSLTDVLAKVDSRPRYSFASSEQLALQIREGAPADVFAAASPKAPRQLFGERLVYRPVLFATNRLVLVVPPSNPARIQTAFDLKRNGVKLVVAQEGVPLGDYTRELLRRLRLTSVLRNLVSQEADARSVVGKVALGEADAGFVYRTDARAAQPKVRGLALPVWAQPKIRYEAAVVRRTKQLAAARAFVARLLGPAGRRALAAAGFGLP